MNHIEDIENQLIAENWKKKNDFEYVENEYIYQLIDEKGIDKYKLNKFDFMIKETVRIRELSLKLNSFNERLKGIFDEQNKRNSG